MVDILNYAGGTCFRVQNDNITLLGNNYRVQGTNIVNSAAVYANNTKGTNITGFRLLDNFNYGINLTNTSTSYVGQNNIGTNGISGLSLYKSNNNTIYNNSMNSNGNALFLSISSNNTLSNNYIYGGNNYGIKLYDNSLNNILFNNQILATVTDGIYLFNGVENNTLDNNTIIGTALNGYGIRIGANVKNNYLVNEYINSSVVKNIIDDSGLTGTNKNYFIYNSSFGEIRWTNMSFLQNLTIRGNIYYPGVVAVRFNSAFASAPSGSPAMVGRFNSSANVTLTGTPGAGMTNPVILVDGRRCFDCYNFTTLTVATVIFNVTHWSNYSIGEDISPPQLSFVSPTLNSSSSPYWYNSGIFIRVNYTSINVSTVETALRNITIYLYNSSHILINITNSTISPLYVRYYDLPEGLYYFNATAWDDFDNYNETETRNFTVDLTKPNATAITPISGLYTNTTTNINFTVNTSDNTGLSRFDLYIYNSTGWDTADAQIINTTNTTSVGVLQVLMGIMNTLVDDLYRWFYRVYDLAGNSNRTEIMNFTVDTITPQLIIHSPQNITYDNGTILLNLTAIDTNIDYIQYDYNGILMTYTGETFMYTTDGGWNVTIYVHDLAGNINVTQLFFATDNLNTSDCKILTRSGKTYTLTANVINHFGVCFDIQNSNIVLNGSGHSIQGDQWEPFLPDAGVYSIGRNNLTVVDFIGISDFAIGIQLDGVNNSIIRNNNMSSNWFNYGIDMEGTTNNNIIEDNILEGNKIGLRVVSGSNYSIINNQINSNTLAQGAIISGLYNTISNNNFSGNLNLGMYLSSFSNGTLYNNTINLNGVSSTTDGLYIENSNYNLINANRIYSNAGNGINLYSGANNTFLNNNIYTNGLYEILDSSGLLNINYFIYNNSNAEIIWDNSIFLGNLTLNGTLTYPGSINTSFNFVSMNPAQFTSGIGYINSSALISLYGNPSAGLPYPQINRDGFLCTDCVAVTPLTNPTVQFVVQSWSNYSLGEEPIHPVACAVLNQPNTEYFLEADILNQVGSCFIITADNITFNGNGHILDGDDIGVDYGIYSLNVRNSAILNFSRISDWGLGIMMSRTIESAIRSTSLSSNTYDIFLSNVNSTSIINVSTNSSSIGLYLNTNVSNNTFSNINFTSHSLYSIFDNSSLQNAFSYSNNFGNIVFVNNSFRSNMTFYGNLTTSNQINIAYNSALFNTSRIISQHMNSSLNITLYMTPGTFIDPVPGKNGELCGSECYNFTDLNSAIVIFNTTTDGRYSVIERYDNIMPLINFTSPTPGSTQIINVSYILVNVTVVDGTFRNTTVNLYNASHVLINSTVGFTLEYFVNISNGGLPSGIYYLNATAADSFPNYNSTETRIIYIDTVVPILNLTIPVNNTASANLTYNFTVNITDNIIKFPPFNYDNLCYQESANVADQTGIDGDCGLNYTGTVSQTSGIIPYSPPGGTWYDGNWASSSSQSPIGKGYGYVNYSKPKNASSNSLWVVRMPQTLIITNFSLFESCWNYDENKLILRLMANNSGDASRNAAIECYDGNWLTINTSVGVGANVIIEEAMYWDMTNYTKVSGIANVSLYIYNTTGLYNQTNTTFLQGIAQALVGIPVTLVDGFYYWFYTAIDHAMNFATSQTFNLTVDSHRPTLAFVTPPTNPTGTVLNISDIVMNVTTTDMTPKNVSFRVYNASHYLVDGATYLSSVLESFQYNATPMSDGLYYYNATSCDIVGNCSYTETRNITIDILNPSINFTNPTPINNSNLSVSNIYANVTAYDRNYINLTIWLYNSTGSLVNVSSWNNSYATVFSVNFTGNPDGRYYLNATVMDIVGHINQTETREIVIDTITPTIQFVAPTNLSDVLFITNNSFILTNVTTNEANIRNLSIIVYNASMSIVNVTSSGVSPLYYNFSVDRDGLYYYRAFINDSFGHNNQTELRNVTIDTTRPAYISITYPVNASAYVYIAPSSITFNSYDLSPSTCWYGNGSVNTTPVACGPGTFGITLSGITAINGSDMNNWTVYVRDYNGLINMSSVFFSYHDLPGLIVIPTVPSSAGGSATASGFDVEFNATAISDVGLNNVSFQIYNNTIFTPQYLVNYSVITYPTNPFTADWNDILTFVRGIYYWWFEATDILGNTYASNVSNITVDVPRVIIIQPANNSLTFSGNNTPYLEIGTNQPIEYCWYNLNGGASVIFYPNIYITVPYGQNNITVFCHNENGTDNASSAFTWYPLPNIGLNIITPRQDQMYRYPEQMLTWTYNNSYIISSWNYSLNGAPNTTMVSGTIIKFPVGTNTVRICGTAIPPMPAPYYNNFTEFMECDDVSFLVTDQLTGAVTDMTRYLWASLFAVILAIFFAYISGSENMLQFLVRVMWYSGEMIIGFGIINESIRFIRTIMGISPI
jgi:parallel beta-helix repeat protein